MTIITIKKSKTDKIKFTLATIPKVKSAKNITSSNGLLTGFLNLTIERAPIMPKDKAISSLIIDVMIHAILGRSK